MDEEDIDIFYESFVDNLNTGDQCVLILGPELLVNQNGEGYKKYFKKLMEETEGSLYFPEENLFHFKDGKDEFRKIPKIRSFYNDSGDYVLLEMIARIRFPLIINVCPDDSLYKILDKKGEKNIRREYFQAKSEDGKDLDLGYEPSTEKPLIFNMFGVTERPKTMILTYRDLFNTIEHLIPKNSLPNHIETYIKNADSILFLGFKFDSWYYQLVCHKLRIFGDDGKGKPTLTASCNSLFSHVIENHFRMIFTDENPSQSISRITKLCMDNGYDELLRDKISFDSLSLFISYSWGDDDLIDHATIIPIIKSYFEENSKMIQLLIDRDAVTYGDSIDSFMTRIGQGKSVIRVISDRYLKSKYAMTEALRISRYQERFDDDSCPNRIYNIVWDDIDPDATVYKKYWKEKITEETNKIAKNLDNIVDQVKAINKKVQSFTEVYQFIDQFHHLVHDQVSLHLTKDDFLKDDEKIVLKPEKDSNFKSFMEVLEENMKKNC